MLEKTIFKLAHTKLAALIVFAPKKDKHLLVRVVRQMSNFFSMRGSYKILRMDELIDSFCDAANIFTNDKNNAFLQMKFDKTSYKKAVSTCHEGLYRVIRVPSVLRNVMGTLQRTMDVLRSTFKWRFVLVNPYDVVIF